MIARAAVLGAGVTGSESAQAAAAGGVEVVPGTVRMGGGPGAHGTLIREAGQWDRT